jgi:hypothetical protein
LAATEPARQTFWRKWVHKPLTDRELAAVRRSVTSGRPFGTETWVQTIAAQLGVPLVAPRRGAPRSRGNPSDLG